ncbi:hypothetical protein RI367_005151 [Sorochytrium milnesiophthora]
MSEARRAKGDAQRGAAHDPDEPTLELDEHEDKEAGANAVDVVHRIDEADVRAFVLNFMTEEQRERYFAWKGVAFKRTHIAKIMTHTTGIPGTNKTVPMIVGGVAKSYIGEILQLAMEVKRERGDEGNLKREHIREAYRRYRVERGTDGVSLVSSTTNSAPPRLFR